MPKRPPTLEQANASPEQSRLEAAICESLCANATVSAREDGYFSVTTPWTFPDGDSYQIYLRRLPSGGYRITDAGHTLMQISYDMDISRLQEGNRASLFARVLEEAGVKQEGGELFVESPFSQIGVALFQLGQTLTRVHDLTFLNRLRVEQTFYEDLGSELERIVPGERWEKNYVVANLENGDKYPVDFKIEGKDGPLFVFGVPNKDKARLVTIELYYFHLKRVTFESLLVFADQSDLPRDDLARLSNVGGEQVSSLAAREDLMRKIRRRLAA